MPIRWGDMDALGHVNNTVYFRYLEQARVEWFASIGCDLDPVAEGPVIVNAHCSFIKQLKYPGEIEVLTYVGPPGRSSFETVQEIRRVDATDQIVAHGGAKVVWVHFPSEKSTPLPDRLRQLLAAAD
ncbi:thioesterase family protein [Herminiimonas sp. CN]|uniref:acyl-CoA thioesterase n=1 Tax=Herminiimonas sp. CN TaxID=1349818 RepID=UPI001EE6905A|nr:acyl-CoA thioesterase [Herminiimonas sp. CN]